MSAANLAPSGVADELIPTRWTLIRRLKDLDDQESWREFFDTYWRLIYGVAVKAGLTHEEAEEVVQETVMSVCRKIGEFKADPQRGSFKAWLLVLTRWRITDQLRKRPRIEDARTHRAGTPSSDDTRSTATEDRLPDPRGSILDVLWEEEWQRNLVDAALEKLKRQVKAKQFQIFYLHVIRELPPTKVARALGVNVGQVYLAKHRLSGLFKKAVHEVEAAAGS
jgi:RNA polymerase sigma-70 factor (ECF subfamily)